MADDPINAPVLPVAPQAAAPAQSADIALWPIGALAVLTLTLIPNGPIASVALGVWGALALLAWLIGAGGTDSLVRRAGPALVMYLVVAALALGGALDLAGAALAPLTVLLLAALLPRPDTGPAARDWGSTLGGVLWALAGTLGLAALLTIPAELGSGAVVVLALVLAYNVGRRAGRMQGQSEPVAIGIGVVVAVLGSLMLIGGVLAVSMVVGLVGGLAALMYAPLPPRAQTLPWPIFASVHHQIAFIAPLTFAILWLVRTFSLGG